MILFNLYRKFNYLYDARMANCCCDHAHSSKNQRKRIASELNCKSGPIWTLIPKFSNIKKKVASSKNNQKGVFFHY